MRLPGRDGTTGDQTTGDLPSGDFPKLLIDPAVRRSNRHLAGQPCVLLHHTGNDAYYRLGEDENRLLDWIAEHGRMDLVLAAVQASALSWETDVVTQFIGTWIRLGIVRVQDGTPDANLGSGAYAGFHAAWKWLRRSGALISTRIPLLHFDRPAAILHQMLGGLYRPPILIAALIAIALSWIAMWGDREAWMREIASVFDRSLWIGMLVVWFLSKIWHEIGHAVAAKRDAVRVGKTGIMFFLFAPLAYVDITDAWRLESRLARMRIALGGIYFEGLISVFAALAWYWMPVGLGRHLAAQVFLVTGPATLLINANPLLRLDGYFVLSDALDIPNLREHGRTQWVRWIETCILGHSDKQCLLRGWRHHAATVHAAASIVFQIVWMTGLIVALSYWAAGLGVLMALLAITLWAIVPISMWCFKHLQAADAKQRTRLLIAMGVPIICTGVLLSRPAMLQRKLPVVVQCTRPQFARAPAGAFVDQVWVDDGEKVRPGQELIRLRNEQLTWRRDVAVLDLEIAQQRLIQLRGGGDLAGAATQQIEVQRLAAEWAELERQVNELTILADRPGVVMTANVRRLQGRYVQPGDELVRVGNPNAKEAWVSLGPSDVSGYRVISGQDLPARLRLRGGKTLRVRLGKLEAAASSELTHPALAASAGGPVAVRPTAANAGRDRGQIESVQPRLVARCEIPAEHVNEVFDGEIGALWIPDDRPLAERLWAALRPE